VRRSRIRLPEQGGRGAWRRQRPDRDATERMGGTAVLLARSRPPAPGPTSRLPKRAWRAHAGGSGRVRSVVPFRVPLRARLRRSARSLRRGVRVGGRCARSLRLRPSRRARVVAVTPSSSSRTAIVRASSITPRSSRATFSISASSTDWPASSVGVTSAGIVAMRASLDARQRRSPAISSNPPWGLTWMMIGCSTPRRRNACAAGTGWGGCPVGGCRAGGRRCAPANREVPRGTRLRRRGRRSAGFVCSACSSCADRHELLGQLVVGDRRRAVRIADRQRHAVRGGASE